MQLSIVIPAFNEEAVIARTLADVRAYCASRFSSWETIVVDDGSTDGTWNALKDFSAGFPELKPIRLAQNSRKGAAVKTGFAAANGSLILMMDADQSTPIATLDAWIPMMQSADVLIGSRDLPGATLIRPQPRYRSSAGRLMNVFIRLKTGLPFLDTQCGFKLFTNRAKPAFAALRSNGWLFDVEILCRLRDAGFRIREVPVQWTNGPVTRMRFAHLPHILQEFFALPASGTTLGGERR